jgi:cellulose 1,4-beta-cellobiosidase
MVKSIAFASAVSTALAQQAGTQKEEFHQPFPMQVCSKSGGCTAESTAAVMDANWRWLHNVGGYENCYDGGWNATFCPDSDSCCKNCALDGIPQEEWSSTYGVNETSGGFSLGLKQGGNVGSRFYLLDPKKENSYRMFNLKNTNSLAENIIRHFDFSTIGFLDDEEESSSFLSTLNLA